MPMFIEMAQRLSIFLGPASTKTTCGDFRGAFLQSVLFATFLDAQSTPEGVMKRLR